MKSIRKMFRSKVPNKLAVKIPLAYFIVIIVTVVFSSILLNRINSDSAQRKVSEASIKTITSIKTNVDFVIGNVDNFSKLMLSDSNLQSLLRQGDVYSNLQVQAKVSGYFYNLIQAESVIDSVYIFDNDGSADNFFYVGHQALPTFIKENIKDAPWYKEAVARNGKYILRLNGGGVFSNNSKENYVSFIRLIRDVNTTKNLGMMVINIPESAFVQSYEKVVEKNSLQVVILDENDEIIAPNASDKTSDNQSMEFFKKVLLQNRNNIRQKFSQNQSDYINIRSDSQQYTVSYLSDEESGWKYISIIPHDAANTENNSLFFFTVLLLLVNGVIFFVSSFLISKSTITPIHQLLHSMKKVNQGDFCEIEIKPNNDEFQQLFDGYNNMIHQINQLLEKIIQEQKTIRKAELNTLQAQIKPHFLYNTLDSIASLALSGETDQVCDLVESLGNYYRISVSKGKDVITIGEEIDMVRNYLNIQKVRYQDLFEVEYHIEESCLKYPILKLVLQPLVENSLYHGIRQKGTPGTIILTAREQEDRIYLSVEDDGVGMSKEQINMILNEEISAQCKSFGLRGTLERVRIFYGDENCFKIESEPEKGTKVSLMIPRGEL